MARDQREVLGLADLVECFDFFWRKGGLVDGEFVEAAVEVADGEVGFFAGGEAPVSNLGATDDKRCDAFVFGGGFLADLPAVEVVGAGAGGDVVGGDEVEPLFAFGVVPDWGRVEDVEEFSFAQADRKEETSVGKELPMGFTKTVVVGKEKGIELAVEAVDFCPG